MEGMEFETELHPRCAVQRVALVRMRTGEPVTWQWVSPSPWLPLGEQSRGCGWASPPRHYPLGEPAPLLPLGEPAPSLPPGWTLARMGMGEPAPWLPPG